MSSPLSDEHRLFYERSLEVTREEIAELDRQIEVELSKVKDQLKELQKAKRAALQMYSAACARLGIPNDLEVVESDAQAD